MLEKGFRQGLCSFVGVRAKGFGLGSCRVSLKGFYKGFSKDDAGFRAKEIVSGSCLSVGCWDCM